MLKDAFVLHQQPKVEMFRQSKKSQIIYAKEKHNM